MAKQRADAAPRTSGRRTATAYDVARLYSVSLALASVACWSGCGSRDIDQTYGKRRGATGEASVNGTAVLAGMFERAGYTVRSREYLSPRADDFDVIVWFPDDFRAPREDAQAFLENWLARGRGRTVIYVGRDYDAATDYWEYASRDAPPAQAVEILRRLALSRATHAAARTVRSAGQQCRWFRVRHDQSGRAEGRRREDGKPVASQVFASGPFRAAVRESGANEDVGPGESDHRTADERSDLGRRELRSTGVRGALTSLHLAPHRKPVEAPFDDLLAARTWLSYDGVPLVWQIVASRWNAGQIIVVQNGSFLLNLPLVDHENRLLAKQLIEACKVDAGQVMFLETRRRGVDIYDEEPRARQPTGFEAFTVWPLNVILLHFLVLGLTLVACRWMVFGRPHELPRPPVSDFGCHVAALGQLLGETRDRAYADARLAEYRRRIAPDRSLGDAIPASKPPASDEK